MLVWAPFFPFLPENLFSRMLGFLAGVPSVLLLKSSLRRFVLSLLVLFIGELDSSHIPFSLPAGVLNLLGLFLATAEPSTSILGGLSPNPLISL